MFIVATAYGLRSDNLGDGGGVDGSVDLSVPAVPEAMRSSTHAGRFDGRGTVGHRERCLRVESCAVAGVGQDIGCDEVAYTVYVLQSGVGDVHCCLDVGCEAGDRALPGAHDLDTGPGAVVTSEPVGGFVECFGSG